MESRGEETKRNLILEAMRTESLLAKKAATLELLSEAELTIREVNDELDRRGELPVFGQEL